jgi:endonuclease/exonuclease/phosphatase family metal-dependent hydrolase
MKVLCWNMAHRSESWLDVASSDVDVALLQEACAPPEPLRDRIAVDDVAWRTEGVANRPWRTAVVGLSDRYHLRHLAIKPIACATADDLAVSRVGTLAVAAATRPERDVSEAILLASMYAAWEKPHSGTGSRWIYADASVHRLVSDISALVGRERGNRIVAAGDLNALYGYGDHGSQYWAGRYQSIFDRLDAIGLVFVGPQAPRGRVADPWPSELPASSRNVPTYYASHQTPATATRQLDFVFASRDIADKVEVHARNQAENWGPSDHCRVDLVVHDV